MVSSLVAISIRWLKKSVKEGCVPPCTQRLLVVGLDGELMGRLAAEMGPADDQEWGCLRSWLYSTLVKELAVAPPEPSRGHFWSLCHVFRCVRCRRLVAQDVGRQMACVSQRGMLVGQQGLVVSEHEMDVNWNVMRHVAELKERLDQDWGRIYWRLWSECHYLLCNTCHWYYPVLESDSCPRHPNNEPIFYFTDEQGVSTTTHPVGRFVCCNAPAYRYHSVPQLAAINGCKTMSHTPTVSKSHNTVAILRIYKIANLEMGEKDDCSFDTVSSNVDAINIMHDESNFVIRPTAAMWNHNYVGPRSLHNKMFVFLQHHDDANEGDTGEECQRMLCCGDGDASTSSHALSSQSGRRLQDVPYSKGCCLPMQDVNADERYLNRPIEYAKRTSKHKKRCCGLQSDQWVSRFSTRFNQDRQREWENNLMHKFNVKLTQRIKNVATMMEDESIGESDWLVKKSQLNKGDQEESDDSVESVDSMSSYCSTLKSTVRVQHSRNTAIWNSHTPLAGGYVRIESVLRQHWQAEATHKQAHTHTTACSNTLLSKVNARINTKTGKAPTFTVQHSHHNRRFYTRSSSKCHLHLPRSAIKTKMLEISMLHEPNSTQESHKDIWSFDNHSQELDYLSAAYIPLPITPNIKHRKYFKSVKSQLSSQWSDLVDLEKAWVAFLRLFSETELSPSKRFRYNSGRLPTGHLVGVSRQPSTIVLPAPTITT